MDLGAPGAGFCALGLVWGLLALVWVLLGLVWVLWGWQRGWLCCPEGL